MYKNLFKVSKLKLAIILGLLLGVILFLVCNNRLTDLRKAHSTFDNYYKFRGCVELLERGSNYGICRISSGQTIKIVQFEGKWYLDGDLPNCGYTFCI